MRKILPALSLFCLLISSAHAADWVNRFDITPKGTATFKASSINIPEAESYEESSVEDYNSAVALNNQAIEALNSSDFKKAENLLKQAVSISPASAGFRKNYLVALNKSGNTKEFLKQAEIQLSLNPEDHQTAYSIGLAYLNNYKDYETAANYISYAINLAPNESNYVLALITALENTGKYSDTVFEILQNNINLFNDSYPYYLLGLKYLDKELYSKAVKTLNTAKQYDKKGYAYHAYTRAAFYGGYLKNLEQEVKETIDRFPNDQNISSTKRIYNSIKDSSYKLTEHIVLKISNASSLEELNFNVRPIKDFQSHQNVMLLSSELISKGKTINAQTKQNTDGSLTINVPKSMWSPELVLELKYKIDLKALYGKYFNTNNEPDIDEIKKDEKFSLDDSRLSKLADFVDNLTLEDSDRFDSYEELYAVKASTAIAKGLNYKENGIDNSVSWALSNLDKCDCTEYSRLLAALCLKKGIPARLVTGFLIRSDFINKETSIGHEWCEVYVNSRGWVPFDATLQSTMHRAYLRNLLNDQIFFEYPNEYDKTRIGVDYIARNSDVTVAIENTYKVIKTK